MIRIEWKRVFGVTERKIQDSREVGCLNSVDDETVVDFELFGKVDGSTTGKLGNDTRLKEESQMFATCGNASLYTMRTLAVESFQFGNRQGGEIANERRNC